MSGKGPEAFRTIAEAAAEVGVPAHVLRFWEGQFSFIQPLKRSGGRRFYRPSDIVMLRHLRRLLHEDGWSIKRVQAIPPRRWPVAAPTPPGNSLGLSSAPGPVTAMRIALDRAVRARDALYALMGSSTG